VVFSALCKGFQCLQRGSTEGTEWTAWQAAVDAMEGSEQVEMDAGDRDRGGRERD
jgi:hypothetical protein